MAADHHDDCEEGDQSDYWAYYDCYDCDCCWDCYDCCWDDGNEVAAADFGDWETEEDHYCSFGAVEAEALLRLHHELDNDYHPDPTKPYY